MKEPLPSHCCFGTYTLKHVTRECPWLQVLLFSTFNVLFRLFAGLLSDRLVIRFYFFFFISITLFCLDKFTSSLASTAFLCSNYYGTGRNEL